MDTCPLYCMMKQSAVFLRGTERGWVERRFSIFSWLYLCGRVVAYHNLCWAWISRIAVNSVQRREQIPFLLIQYHRFHIIKQINVLLFEFVCTMTHTHTHTYIYLYRIHSFNSNSSRRMLVRPNWNLSGIWECQCSDCQRNIWWEEWVCVLKEI